MARQHRQNGVQFSYDLKGNLLSDGTRSYSYTAENRLASGASTNIYYDALGRLVHLTSGINFHYHGGEFIETQSASGATRRYVHGPGVDEPLVWYEGAGTNDRRYLHADERGSIVAVSDDSGNVIGINKYDEYGVPAATNIGTFGYTGQVWLPELGLWHYKARMYDPRLGRFLQPDPIGYEDGLNMYAYAGADPVNMADSTGTKGVNGNSICRPGIPCSIDGVDQEILKAEARQLANQSVAQQIVGGWGNVPTGMDPSAPTVEAPGAVITGKGPRDAPWIVDNGRFVRNPDYNEPWHAPYWEEAFVLGPPLVALFAAAAPEVVAVEGPRRALFQHGKGRVFQIRFFKDRLVLRLDFRKPNTHLNVQGRSFNHHIPRR
jgi:RHS repeat-associated protein